MVRLTKLNCPDRDGYGVGVNPLRLRKLGGSSSALRRKLQVGGTSRLFANVWLRKLPMVWVSMRSLAMDGRTIECRWRLEQNLDAYGFAMDGTNPLCRRSVFGCLLRACVFVGSTWGLVGCASSPLLQSSHDLEIEPSTQQNVALVSHESSVDSWNRESQIERGQPNVVVDGVGWVVGVPSKLFMWNRKVDNHSISLQTERELQEYLASRNLQDVKVRLNQYDPVGEWQRLAANKEVGAGWRYTMGGLKTLGYTLLPGRVFGRDDYNPYTNSVYVYSDVPELAMAEAAKANDVNERLHPGSYAFVQSLPIIKMRGEAIATKDVLAYVAESDSLPAQQQAVQVLYSRYGVRAGQSFAGVPGVGSVAMVGGAVAGHATGRIRSNQLASEYQERLAQAELQQQESREQDERTRAHIAAFEQSQKSAEKLNEFPTFDWDHPATSHDVPTEINRAGFEFRE